MWLRLRFFGGTIRWKKLHRKRKRTGSPNICICFLLLGFVLKVCIFNISLFLSLLKEILISLPLCFQPLLKIGNIFDNANDLC